MAQRLARAGASLPAVGSRRPALCRQAAAAVPDRRPHDVSHVSRPRSSLARSDRPRANRATPPRRPDPRMAPVVLDRGRLASPSRPLPVIGRPVRLALVALHGVAFAAIALARLSGVGRRWPRGGASRSPSPRRDTRGRPPDADTIACRRRPPRRRHGVAGPDARPEPRTQPARTYKVKRGDTLSGIAARFGTTVRVLATQRHQTRRASVGAVLERRPRPSVAGPGSRAARAIAA